MEDATAGEFFMAVISKDIAVIYSNRPLLFLTEMCSLKKKNKKKRRRRIHFEAVDTFMSGGEQIWRRRSGTMSFLMCA